MGQKPLALNKNVPTGKRLTFVLKGEKETEGVTVELHYDLYDHIPVIRKSMEVTNNTPQSIDIDAFQLEYLAFANRSRPAVEIPLNSGSRTYM